MSSVKKTVRMTPKQLATIVEFMDTHEDVYLGKITADFSREMKNYLWEVLTEKLNTLSTDALGRASVKAPAKWQRAWIDWKCSVKKKARSNLECKSSREKRCLSLLEIKALRMFDRIEGKSSLWREEDLFMESAESNPECSTKPDIISVRIEDVKSVATEKVSATQVSDVTEPAEMIIEEKEVSDLMTDASDVDATCSPPIVIKDVTSCGINDDLSIAIKRVPRVVLNDFASGEPKDSSCISNNAIKSPSSSTIINVISSGSSNVIPARINNVVSNRKNTVIPTGLKCVIPSVRNNVIPAGKNDAVRVGIQQANPGEISNSNSLGVTSYAVKITPSGPIITNKSIASQGQEINDSVPVLDNISTSAKQKLKLPQLHVSANRKESRFWRIINKRRAAVAQSSSSTSKTRNLNVNPRLEPNENLPTTERYPKQGIQSDVSEETTENNASEEFLGGLPLTLQTSILERLDTLNRSIETNTCALTILSKAIRDSSDSQMRAINNLSKVLENVGNALLASTDLLMTSD